MRFRKDEDGDIWEAGDDGLWRLDPTRSPDLVIAGFDFLVALTDEELEEDYGPTSATNEADI